jgi:hypothetical protein
MRLLDFVGAVHVVSVIHSQVPFIEAIDVPEVELGAKVIVD